MGFKETVLDYLKFDELKANFIKLIEAKLELKKLEVQDQAEKKFAEIFTKIIIGVFCFIAFLMANILGANYLNQVFNNFWGGYVCFILVYIFIAIMIFANKNKFEKLIRIKIREAIDNSNS